MKEFKDEIRIKGADYAIQKSLNIITNSYLKTRKKIENYVR